MIPSPPLAPATASPTADEGYVKYVCEHTPGNPPVHPLLDVLDVTRTALFDIGLIGVYASGIGFGNLSVRGEGGNFIISGTGTGRRRELGPAGYSLVTACDPLRNHVACTGVAPASSEAMSHWAIYTANAAVNCVIHIHSAALFNALLPTDTPRTPESAPCGTPALAGAISDLVRNLPGNTGLFITTGHAEGLMAYGPSIGAAQDLLVALYRERLF